MSDLTVVSCNRFTYLMKGKDDAKNGEKDSGFITLIVNRFGGLGDGQ